MENKGKIVVGMSGGIDSSISLLLLKKAGWEPIGVSLKLSVWKDKNNKRRENACCTYDSLNIARGICKKLKVPYYIIDARNDFKKEVIDYFIKELKNKKTPNPCVICNRHLKFKKLFEVAKSVGAKFVATGHYARVEFNKKSKKFKLLKGKDKNKDQSYSLSFLPQEWLKNIIFPLGEYQKEEVYEIAKKEGFKFFLKKKESQDFCFIANKSYPKFLEKVIGQKRGLILDAKKNILGKHDGLHFYTIGQRKGIKIFGGPYYVTGFAKKKNILYVSKDKKDLLKKEIKVFPYHLISGEKLKKPVSAGVKTRYQQELKRALILPDKKGLKIIFKEGISSPTPGQFAVFYEEDICLGGGEII